MGTVINLRLLMVRPISRNMTFVLVTACDWSVLLVLLQLRLGRLCCCDLSFFTLPFACVRPLYASSDCC